MKAYTGSFINFLTNPILLSGIFSWLGAQFLKTIIELVYGRIKSFKILLESMIWRTGGMPSSHSAVVMAVCVSVGIKEGVSSSIFILSIMLAFITMRDAVGVRRSNGIHAKKLNEFGRLLEKNGLIENYTPIKEVNGHTPIQVLLGALFGGLIGLSMSLLK
ncbi:MAG: divergent PAP2 family protein [Treponema sp.]|nr:divergent PAP2 family protein [Treponema sp.]